MKVTIPFVPTDQYVPTVQCVNALPQIYVYA